MQQCIAFIYATFISCMPKLCLVATTIPYLLQIRVRRTVTKLMITRDMTPKTPPAATAISPAHDSLSKSVQAVKIGGDTQVFTQQQPTFSTCIIGRKGSYSGYNAGGRDSRTKRTTLRIPLMRYRSR